MNDRLPPQPPRATLLRHILTLAIPISIAAMVQTSYHLINAFWVGRIDPDSVAIITLCFPVLLIMISIGSGLSLGGSILIAQAHGAQDRRRIDHLAGQTLTTLALLALLLSTGAFLAAPAIVELLGAPDHLVATAIRYLRISLAGTVFMFLSLAYQSVLRSLGSARAPLLVIVPSVALNALLDPLLIFGWGSIPALGVAGAAYGIVFRITTFTIIPTFGISMATSILIGQSLGARRLDQCDRIAVQAMTLAGSVMGGMGLMLFLFAAPVARVFVPADPALAAHGATVLRIFALSFPLIGVQMTLTGALRGAGDTLAAMTLTLAGTWLIQIPLAIALSRLTTLQDLGLWWSAPLAGVINVLLVGSYYRTGRWKRRFVPA